MHQVSTGNTQQPEGTNRTDTVFACPEGTFADETGLAECKKCLEGAYVNVTGQIECFDCPDGTFANTTGLAECYRCSHTVTNNRTNCGKYRFICMLILYTEFSSS